MELVQLGVKHVVGAEKGAYVYTISKSSMGSLCHAGVLPSNWSNWKTVESLDLSHNNLSGKALTPLISLITTFLAPHQLGICCVVENILLSSRAAFPRNFGGPFCARD